MPAKRTAAGFATGFEGRPEPGLGREGEVLSGHLGFDRSVREGLLRGLVLNHSGEGGSAGCG